MLKAAASVVHASVRSINCGQSTRFYMVCSTPCSNVEHSIALTTTWLTTVRVVHSKAWSGIDSVIFAALPNKRIAVPSNIDGILEIYGRTVSFNTTNKTISVASFSELGCFSNTTKLAGLSNLSMFSALKMFVSTFRIVLFYDRSKLEEFTESGMAIDVL